VYHVKTGHRVCGNKVFDNFFCHFLSNR